MADKSESAPISRETVAGLEQLIQVLRTNGVTAFEGCGVKLLLSPAEAAPAPAKKEPEGQDKSLLPEIYRHRDLFPDGPPSFE
jgi:hypothetical protein